MTSDARTVLAVDDSPSVRAFAQRVLGARFECVVRENGAQALAWLAEHVPAALVLDLTMPLVGGAEVLRRVRADARLSRLPVVVVSSERERAAECLALGADAFLPKPVTAAALLEAVERAAGGAGTARVRAVLPVQAGRSWMALSLEHVSEVLLQLPTSPLAFGPSYLRAVVRRGDDLLPVLDVPRRLGEEHSRALEDRKLVVVEVDGRRIALCVDDVGDPEELDEDAFQPVEKVAEPGADRLRTALLGLARTGRGPLPVVAPKAWASTALLALGEKGAA